jgi:ADP-dependent NAD(P)H-hydrate dehydratase
VTRPTLVTPALLRRLALPAVDGTLGKESRGCVLVVGGSEEIPGAVMLAALGALRAGAGKLQVATSADVAPAVAVALPEARVIGLAHSRRGELARGAWRALEEEVGCCDALLVGPGMMDPAAGAELVRRCLRGEPRATLVVDAAPMQAFARRRAPVRGARVVLTPHAGEMAKLWGVTRDAVLADPVGIARAAAARFGAVVALKGVETVIAAPDGATYRNTAGNAGLGTSGSGDVLSGVIAGLCARGADPLRAALWGVHLHACAGDALARAVGPVGYLARELLAELPRVLHRLAGRAPPRRP